MANHNLPQTTSTYANFVSELSARLNDIAYGLDPAVTTATNVPTNAIRWNSTSKYWEKFNGTVWSALSASYTIAINGSVGATTPSTGAFTTLSSSSTTALASGTTIGGNAAVTVSDTQTLTNKTLTLPIILSISNSGTITIPTGTDTLVGKATTDTLTNKTLTAPKFADLGFIADPSGNELLIFDSVASAINEITLTNAATGTNPSLSATGTDTNISLNLISKGTGVVQANGVQVVTTTGALTLTNKTLTTPILSGTASGTTAGALGYLSGALSYGNGTVQRTVANLDEAQTLTNKTMSTSSVWNGTQVGVTYGGTGTTSAPTQGGIIYGSSATAYASTAAGTTNQILQSNASSAPTWVNFDAATHAPDMSYKKIVRLATTADLNASTFSANVLSGYSNTQSLALTTTAASTTITTTSTAGLLVGAVVSTATTQVAAGTTVATISNDTTFTVNNLAAIATTAITGTGATATATFATQTYAPYAVGSTIVVSGTTPATYSGSFVVTTCTTTSVSWASTETVTATVQGSINFTIAAGTSISTNFAQTIAALSIDGNAVALNDRILVKDQIQLGAIATTDAAKYNGIYSVTATGSTTVPWTLTRTADADASTDLDGALVNVSVGTANGGKAFKTYFLGTSTLNTTPIYWNRLADISASTLIGTPTTAVGIDIATDTKTQTLVTGNVTDLAINSFGITTVRAVAASTYTRASTVYIAGAPAASTNATITTPYALYIAGGNTYMAGNLQVAGILNITGTATTAGNFNASATTPTGTTRLNYEGYLYPTYLNLVGSADTATAATHYFVETGTDGFIRPKTLANAQAELVTTTTVNAALATSVGTITTGTWNATNIGLAYGGTNASLTAVNGGIVYSTASAFAISLAGTSGQALLSGGAGAPTWGTLSVSAGGTGATSLTGILKGTGTTAFAVATASDITTAIGTTAVTNATNATNLTGSGTISSTTTGTTQTYGDSSTKIATTAFVDALRDIPANSQSVSYSLALTDRGKAIDFTGAAGQTITIPANTGASSVAFPIGSTISIFNTTANTLSIAITTDTLRLAGTATTGTRTLAQYGTATIRKVASTVWIIFGVGVS